MNPTETVLIATLGSEPQVVTLAVDFLQAQLIPVKRVIVLHTDPATPVIAESLGALHNEFRTYQPYLHLILEPVHLLVDGRPIADVTTPEDAQAVLRTTYRQLSDLKEAGKCIHLCAAGGRKAMAMYAMLVAQLLFDEKDYLWTLISSDAFRLERRLHDPSGEASLVRVPVLPWRLSLTEKQIFINTELTSAEANVLELAARYGLTDREIAERRGSSPKTVGAQLSTIYDKVRVFLGYRHDVRVDRNTLAAEFSAYYEVMEALGPEPP